MDEFEAKLKQIDGLLAERDLDGLLIRQTANFAWMTCGAASYVNVAASEGAASLLILPGARYLVTDNIEAPRLEAETQLCEQGWAFHIDGWHTAGSIHRMPLNGLAAGLRLGADVPYPGAVDLSADLRRLRTNLHPAEQARFRTLGRLCAGAMDRAVRAVKPGMMEFEIAALLAAQTQRSGVLPIVNLIATDERISRFRHPLPTARRLDKYAMLVLCGRQHGLVCSITRLVHFGSLPDDLRRKAEAVAGVDAAFIAATQPGRMLSEVFQAGREAYVAAGYPDEWRLHHQGGPAGYEPREAIATPDTHDVIAAGQAYAWNPSITGTKSEDTILVGEDGFENLTEIDGWPTVEVDAGEHTIPRPAILEIT
jgi:Xaa-Pro aminopeptidase